MSARIYATQGNLAYQMEETVTPSFVVVNGGGMRCRRVQADIARPSATPAPKPSLARTIVCSVILMLLLGLFLCAGWVSSAGRAEARQASIDATRFETIEVKAGDSLWDIAEDHAIEGLTIQEISDVIRDRNQLDSALLHPGMEIEVPLA